MKIKFSKLLSSYRKKIISVFMDGTEDDTYLNFQEYSHKTFYAIIKIQKDIFVIQPVRILYISNVDTLLIFYIDSNDKLFLETRVNASGHNLWTTKNAARVELCRRNPNITLEDLNHE